MTEFDPEPDGLDERLTAAGLHLRPGLDFEDRLILALPAHRPILGIRATERPFVRRAIFAAAASVLLGISGIAGLAEFGPSLNRARAVSDAVKVRMLAEQLEAVDQHDRNGKSIAAPQPAPGAAVDGVTTNFGFGLDTAGYSSPIVTAGQTAGAPAQVAAKSALSAAVPVITTEERNKEAEFYRAPMVVGNGNLGENRPTGGGRGGGGGGFGGGRGGLAAEPAARGRSVSNLSYQAVALADDAAKDVPAKNAAPAAEPAAVQPAVQAAQNPAVADRKIIRNGEMEFEVESFDAASERLHKIVQQCGGYVGATDSQQLPNGKVHGSITVRVPPQNLDNLVMMLRALGDLKRQQVSAEDITKQYTDLQSQLKAAKAMEDRLLEIIKTANAQVKDLLAVEKELANWREKDETLTGQINFYNNQVALSTLTITLIEKDIGQAAMAQETQTIDAGLEADDVTRARDELFKAVDAAKGRILRADLNSRQAGQYTAEIVATLPPDAAGGVIDRLHQLGRLARLESTLQQTTSGAPASPDMKVTRNPTILKLSIYNVAAYTARTTDNVVLACDNVEESYHGLLDFLAKTDGARVVTSTLSRPTPDTATGVVVFDVRESSADGVLAFLRTTGTVLQLNVTENPDSENVTATKRSFVATLNPLASIAPQETDELTLLPAAGDVRAAYDRLLDFAAQPAMHVRVIDKNLQQDNGVYTSASLVIETPRASLDAAEHAIAGAGKIVSRKATRQPDSPNVVDSKVLLRFSFVNVDALQPRQTLTRQVAVTDVSGAYQAILDAAHGDGAKVLDAQLNIQPGQRTTARIQIDIPAEKQGAFEETLDKAGTAFGGAMSRLPDSDATTDARIRMELTLWRIDDIPPRRTYQIQVQTADPRKSADDISAGIVAGGGSISQRTTSTDAEGNATTALVVHMPLASAATLADAARGKGTLIQDHSTEDPQAPTGAAARAALEIKFTSEPSVVADNDGLAAAIKQGVVTSVRGLLWSLEMLVIGLLVAGPWAAVVWGAWRFFGRRSKPSRP